MSKRLGDVAAALEGCHIAVPGWHLRVTEERGVVILNVYCEGGTCNLTGQPMNWVGRKWIIEPTDTRHQIVQTAFKAYLSCVEHEARETFLYKGQPVFGPHHNIDQLVYMARCERGEPQ